MIKTFIKINKPMRFYGLSSGQLGLFVLIIVLVILACIFLRVNSFIMIVLIAAILSGGSFLFERLKKEHKAGNPNYLAGLRVSNSTPKKIVDKYRVFNMLIKKENV